MRKNLQRLLITILVSTLALPALVFQSHALAAFGQPPIIDSPVLVAMQAAKAGDMITVIVTMRQQANLNQFPGLDRAGQQEALIRGLQATAAASQASLNAFLNLRRGQGLVDQTTSFWIFNGQSVSATSSVIQELAARPDVAEISTDAIDILPAAVPEANLVSINAPALWSMGYSGQGVVVSNLDSGVSLDNPDIAARWRGGSNSWYDPYRQHPTSPIDLSGHGTWTMGVMVAGDASGASIGVAPQAQWIAARIFNDQGSSTKTAIHQAFQWLLDPDGNPSTPDAPQVVNNSWTMSNPGCDLSFQLDLQSLRAAGILPVFAAGNFGPSVSTSASPANYPEALAVGAVDNNGAIYAYGSRGPSACGEVSTIYPDLVAPGVNIRTADLYGMYTSQTGTSLSAPHVAGGLALLLSAFPSLSASHQQSALINSAVDLGDPGPDNTFGYGKLDLLAAYQWLQVNPNPTSTPTPTATATPTPTPTPTPTATTTPDSIFSDGFEMGNFNAWTSTTTGGGKLSVMTGAALAGVYGMQAQISSTTPIYVVDSSPAAEASYHARFYFSPNSVSIGKGKIHDLVTGMNANNSVIFRLQIQYTSGNYQIRAVGLNNNGKTVPTTWYSISNASHPVEIAWQAATTQTGTNGSLSLYLDGLLKETRSGLANGNYRLEQIQLGPQGLSTGISGIEYFDAFNSTRTRLIGP